MEKRTKLLVITAVIAGIYGTLTICLAPISYGAIQFRLSEIMTLLAFVNPICTPGLVIGCIIANFFSPFGVIDIIVGTIATFLAVYPMRYIKNIYIASLLPTISNGIIVGLEVAMLAKLPLLETIAYIALGEFVVVSVLGVVTTKMLLKNKHFNEIMENLY
ncbi:MAG: QueT transporter family protein [Filifactoraceae bacterium]